MLANLNQVLKDACEGGYAVGLFNTIDSQMLSAVIAAAEEMRSPVIIGTAEVLLPFGDLPVLAPAMVEMAKRASVPVVVHYDHGLTYARCVEALQLGFTSIMYDASAKDIETNYRETAELVKLAHAMGATVEGEIGHVGNTLNGDEDIRELYTTVEQACAYVQNTGVDALAIAIGTAHGAYTHKPKLDIDRLAQIHSALDTPLVLHGGSGLTDEDFRNVIAGGISKINIYTDICTAAEKAMQEGLDQGLIYQGMCAIKLQRVKEAAMEKMRLFGSAGKV